jgi:hypothetical protein
MRKKYLFFADADLRVFISELVAQQYSQDGEHHFFSYHPRTQETWNLYPWESRTYLPWIHREGRSWIEKNIGLRKRIGHILQTVGDVCEGADEVILHSYEFYSERINYLFNYLRDRYPGIIVRGRLIPDGSLNITRRRMSGVRSLAPMVNRAKWFFDRELRYHCYYGDRLGADADIVDRIYLPRGFPNEYDSSKIFFLDMPRPQVSEIRSPKKTAIVLGTAMTQTRLCSKSEMSTVAAAIHACLQERQIETVYYKPHHKEQPGQFELWSPGYQVIQTQKAVERLLLEQPFDLLIGQCSTALITARLMILDLPVISCGLEVVERHAPRNRSVHQYRSICDSLGIPVLRANQRAA